METLLLIAIGVISLAALVAVLMSRKSGVGADAIAGLTTKLDQAERRTEELRTQVETARREQATETEKTRGETIKSVGDEFTKVQELLLRRLKEDHDAVDKRLGTVEVVLEKRLESIQTKNEERLDQIRKTLQGNLNETIEKNAAAFARVDKHLTDLSGQTRQIVDYSRDLQKIHEILAAPKLRGSLGEFVLENMLGDVIPKERYRVQWDVNGNKADAAVQTEEGWICIDSKFPLENFRKALEARGDEKTYASLIGQFYRDVRGRIDEIRTKYIVPGVTLDFAFMFVPAENVYYEINNNTELADYARSCKVWPVSPNTLYAFLATIAVGFRGMKISREAKRIEQTLLALKQDFGAFREHYGTLGRHVRNAFQKFQETETDMEQFGRRLETLSMDEQQALPDSSVQLSLDSDTEDEPASTGDTLS